MFFSGLLLFRQEHAPQQGLDSQHWKNIGSNVQRPQFFGIVGAGQVRSPVLRRPHLREGLTLAPPVDEIRRSHGIAALVENDYQPAIIFIGKRPQQHGIDHTENGGVGPNPHRQCDDRHRGKSRALAQRANGVAQVLK